MGRTFGAITVILLVLKYNVNKVFTLVTLLSGLNWIFLAFNINSIFMVDWVFTLVCGFCESSLYGLPIYLIWKFFSPDKKIIGAGVMLWLKLIIMKFTVICCLLYPIFGSCAFTNCKKIDG